MELEDSSPRQIKTVRVSRLTTDQLETMAAVELPPRLRGLLNTRLGDEGEVLHFHLLRFTRVI